MKNLRRSSDKSHPLEDSSAIGLEGIKKCYILVSVIAGPPVA